MLIASQKEMALVMVAVSSLQCVDGSPWWLHYASSP